MLGWVAPEAAIQTVTARDPSTAPLPTTLSPLSTSVTTATKASELPAPEQYSTPGGAIKEEREREERGGDACAVANAVAAANYLSDITAPTPEVSSTGVSKFRQERF